MNTPTARLDRLAAEAAGVDLDALQGMPAAELVEFTTAVERLGRVVDAMRVATATTIEQRSDRWLGTAGLAQSYGFRRGFELIEQVTGVTGTEARRRVRLGEQVRPRVVDLGAMQPPLFPVLGAAMESGRVGVDAARIIVAELSCCSAPRVDVDALRIAERVLVAQAAGTPEDLADLACGDLIAAGLPDRDAERTISGQNSLDGLALSADLVAVHARVWRDVLDPDGVEPRADVARLARGVNLGRVPRNGLYPLRGNLTPDVAATLRAYFDALITRDGPSFERHEGAELYAAGVMEKRTPDQQRHDLLAALIRSAGAAAAAGVSAEVPAAAPLVIRIDADQLNRPGGTGSISGIDGPVPESFLRQIACDGGIQLMTMKRGKIIRLGTKGRFFTAQQRKAVAIRDGDTCVIPFCKVPYPALEAHHVIEHSRGGRTHVDNCVLLCWWHHHLIDTGIWVIEMVGGRPRIRVPIRNNLRLAA